MFNVAMIGWGMSAKTFHLPFIESIAAFRLAAMVTTQSEACQERYPNVAVYTSIDELISGVDIELAVIATPNHMHFQQCYQLLSAGINVIVDKPATLTAEELAELYSIARANGVWLTVFHNRRWDGDFMALQTQLESGVLGQPKVFLNQFDRFRPLPRDRWREHAIDGAGIWYDLGPHLVDQTLVLFGRPDAIYASLRAMREGAQNVDYALVSLYYDELEVVLRCSPYCSDPMLRFQLETTQGTWRKFQLDPQEEQLKSGKSPADHDWLKALPAEQAQWSTPESMQLVNLPKGDYSCFYLAVAEALANEDSSLLLVAPQQAIDVATVIDAAMQSARNSARQNLIWRAHT